MLRHHPQDARAVWRSKAADLYDRYSDRLLLDHVFGSWESRTAKRRRQTAKTSCNPYCEGDLPEHLGFVVATSRGLFVCRGTAVCRTIAGRYFGVTIRGTRLYAFEQVGLHGQIVSFELDASSGTDAMHIWGFNRWIHQIDFLDDELAVIDTLHSRILIYQDIGTCAPLHWSRYHREIAPAGRDRKGRNSPYHRQFNSIYRCGKKIHVVAHNDSVKTGRASEIWVFDANWELVHVLSTVGQCCHNLVAHDRGMLMNWSLQRSLRLGNLEVYSTAEFNRGLAYDGQYVLVGNSPYTESFTDRESRAGFVDVLNNDFHRIGRVVFPGSSVRDVRIIGKDIGLSNNAD